MSLQPQLFPEEPPAQPPDPLPDLPPAAKPLTPAASPAPLWLQRLSLFILVIFCIYLGVIVTVLPWWSSIWDQNPVFAASPRLAHILRLGTVRGIISGFGLLDIWIGISEAIHYRDHRS